MTRLIEICVGAVSRAGLALLAAALVACASLRPDTTKAQTRALPPVADTASARYVHGEVNAHPGLSGFRLLTRSDNALMSRIAFVDHATHSIDLQYYIFNNDPTGRLLAQRLLAAADRGVRVRMLLDDINSGDSYPMLNALEMHPNIDVRLFNPFRTRHPSLLSRTAQYLLDASRLNRRMHNKSFIVDGWVAIVGGRNIGDEYFDAGNDVSFRDMDLIAIGPVVKAAAESFDRYWNCDVAFTLASLRDGLPDPGRLEQERLALGRDARTFAQSDYASAFLDHLPRGATTDQKGQWYWGHAEFIADEPEKVETKVDDPSLRIGPRIAELLRGAQSEVLLISPYFIPGENGTAFLTGLAQRGVAIKVLTNSLAASDEPAAHAGYAHYRLDLLRGGVQLFELQPVRGKAQPVTDKGKSSGSSLHAKAAVIDRHWVFLGSMNIDPRSKLLNTEMGVIVDCPALAAAVAEFFQEAARPDAAFSLQLAIQDGREPAIRWTAAIDGKIQVFDSEPYATPERLLEVSLIRLLPLEQLL
jgi:cardiolipin synthase C